MMTNLMTISVKKASISSKPTTVYLSCPPLCGLFSIQQNAKGGLSCKVKKNPAGCHTMQGSLFFPHCAIWKHASLITVLLHTLVFHALRRNKHPQVHRINLLGSRFHRLHRFFTEGILCANGSFATAVDLIVNPIRAQHMGF